MGERVGLFAITPYLDFLIVGSLATATVRRITAGIGCPR
jgi:hypothetical protein